MKGKTPPRGKKKKTIVCQETHRNKCSIDDSYVALSFNVEAEYGRKIDAYKDSIVIDGELIEGNVLRVGRLAMVFQTADETQTHAWNNSTRAWEELDNSYRNPTRRGLRIANKLATVDLMELPLPSATEAN